LFVFKSYTNRLTLKPHREYNMTCEEHIISVIGLFFPWLFFPGIQYCHIIISDRSITPAR